MAKKTRQHPDYTYERHGSVWAIISWRRGDFGALSGTMIANRATKEEAKKEVYRLNGWKYDR